MANQVEENENSQTINVSKKRREELLGRIEEIKTFIEKSADDENRTNLLKYISDLEKDVGAKKYGLVFEEHREEIDSKLEENTPVLTEEEKLFIDKGGEINFLIEGDNLASLRLLEKTHRGKIDLIYIDPPYNTGNNDFRYGDSFVDQNDTFRHSKWLSFMSKRLSIAKRLLSEKGVIFISIDDNEQAPLKMLCDEIFGEKNFVSVLHWKRKKQPSYLHGQVAGMMEYVLVYAKDRNKLGKLSLSNPTDSNTRIDNASNHISERFIKKGICVKLPKTVKVIKAGTYKNRTMETEYLDDVYIEDGITTNAFRAKARFRDSQERIDKFCDEGVLFITKNYGFRRDKLEEETSKKKSITDLLLDWGDNQDSDDEQTNIFGQKVFSYPKPTKLIKNLVMSTGYDQSIILDFFAGSGTTGHAVLKLNAEDGGNRRFILCTNNENNICRDITYERIKRVIENEKYAASLKYYRVDFVPITERLFFEYADELLHHVRELVELENGINFTGNSRLAIVLTEKELEDFASSLKKKTECEAVYLAHDLIPGKELESLLREKGIKINIIPEYYFRELEEKG